MNEERGGEKETGGGDSFVWGAKHAHRGTDFLPLLSFCLFCVNDFHEKALNKIPHLRNASVR